MLLAAFIVQAAVAQPVATCRVPNDLPQRLWILERRETGVPDRQWEVVFSGRSLDKPRAILSLPNASPVVTNDAVVCTLTSDRRPIKGRPTSQGRPTSEWIVGAGFASAVKLFQSDGNRRYAVQNVSWGRELTRPLGPGLLRGRFVWAVEMMPVFFQTTPSHVYGVGFAPVVWRWNLAPQPRWSAFAELSMGGLWTTDPVPEGTERVNFTAHWGGGVRIGSSPHHQFVLGYRFQHISNGNQLRTNPGVNSHVALLGWSMR